MSENNNPQKNKKKKYQEEELVNPCTRCGKHNCVDGQDYCGDCIEKMLNTRISFAGWFAGAVSLVLSVIATALVVMHFPCAVLEIRAENAAKDGRWMDACYYYEQMDDTITELRSTFVWKQGKDEPILRKFFVMGTNTRAKMFEAYAEMYDPVTAVQELMIKDYADFESMAEGEAALINNKKVAPYWEIYSGIYSTNKIISESEDEPAELTYESEIAYVEKFENVAGTDKVYLAYQKYEVAAYYNKSADERVKWLSECDKLAKASGKDYKWLYYYDYAQALSDQGRVDEALSLVDMLISENKNNFTAYTKKTDILLSNGRIDEAEKFVASLDEEYGDYTETIEMQLKVNRCKGDYEKAKLIGNVLVSDYSASPETYRQLALLYLIEGDYRKAFEYADIGCTNAYNLNYYGANISDEELYETLYVCSKLLEENCELTDDEKVLIGQIKDMFGEEYEPGAEAKAIVNGKKTVKEILTQGDYDLV